MRRISAGFAAAWLACAEYSVAQRNPVGQKSLTNAPTNHLVEQLGDKNSLRRYEALSQLAKLMNTNAAPEVVKLIDDPDRDVRYAALDALVKFEARQYTDAIWKLVDSRQPSHLEDYAIAALVAYGQDRAIPLAVKRATDPSRRSQMLNALVMTDAKSVGPAFIEVLKTQDVLGGDIGTDGNTRCDLMICLGKLKVTNAIPVLLQYVRSSPDQGLRGTAAVTLGALKAKDAVPDLISILRKADPKDGLLACEVALALSDIGDQAAWGDLINFVSRPDIPFRNTILGLMNWSLDPKLWETITTKKVRGLHFEAVDKTVDHLCREGGVRIVLHFAPKDGNPWPETNTGNADVELIVAIQGIVHILATDTGVSAEMSPFTFAFRNGEVHILPIDQAITWWKDVMTRRRP